MKDNYYECNSCSYKTPRWTNANRHIKLVHGGVALSFNYKTGKFSTSRKIKSDENLSEIQLEEQQIHKIVMDISEPLKFWKN